MKKAIYFCAGALSALMVIVALKWADAGQRNYSPYRKLNLFSRVLSYVEANYVDPIDDNKLIYGAIDGLLDSLDPHSVFLTPDEYRQLRAQTEGAFGGLGIEVEMRDGALIIITAFDGTPAQQAGLQSGDLIVAIEGQLVRDLRMDDAIRLMRGAIGTKIKLTIKRPTQGQQSAERQVVLTRSLIKIHSVEGKFIAPGVVHLQLKAFQETTAAEAERTLKTLASQQAIKGLVLDMRNNPGGLLDQSVKVADLFLESGLIVKTIGKNGKVLDSANASQAGTFDNFPIVCLVNSGTASAAEIVAGALQDHRRSVIMGTKTFGKGSVQTMVDLDDGSGLKLTIARYVTPTGRSIQERGIFPDIVVQAAAPATQPDKQLREKDLRGHLRNPKAAQRAEPNHRLSDFQLQTALDHLRAAEIFRSR